MDQTTLIAIIALAAVVLLIGVWLTMRKSRTDHLRGRFGDEYDRTVENANDRVAAEAALLEREKRVDALDIRPLNAAEHSRFADEWREVKAIFVDSPTEAVLHADRMLATMMKTKGFPMGDFDRRYEDLTVNHSDVARHYREGHQILDRHNSGDANTEDLRQAMKHFEGLYDCLICDAEQATAVNRDPVASAPPMSDDARPVTMVRDTDGDGRSDTVFKDLDRDGDADLIKRDVDGDGHTDRVAIKAD